MRYAKASGDENPIHLSDDIAQKALDEIIKIIRKSDGKADAATKIMARFKQLDAEQTRQWAEEMERICRAAIGHDQGVEIGVFQPTLQ